MDQDIWQNILDKLEENINEQSFKTWFSNTHLVDFSDSSLTVQVGSQFSANYMNTSYRQVLSEISQGLYGRRYEVNFVSKSRKKESKSKTCPVMEIIR